MNVQEKQESAAAPAFIRVQEFVRQTGMSRSDVYRALYNGTLYARKVGRCWYIEANEVTDYLDRMDERGIA